MKPNIKVGSFLLAIVMMFSVFAIAGCTPTTINKEWSYKTSKADAALAASVFHFGEIKIPELKSYLCGEGITIR